MSQPLLLKRLLMPIFTAILGMVTLHAETTLPAYNCYDAVSLSCGDWKWVAPRFDNYFTSANYDPMGCTSSPTSYEGKDYVFTIDAGTIPKDVTISLTRLTADMDILVFRTCGSGVSPSMSDCIVVGETRSNSYESVVIPDAIGTYYIVVDGPEAYHNSNTFEIGVECNTAPIYHGPTCHDNVTKLWCDETYYQPASGNNSFNSSNYDISACTHVHYAYEGYDYVYEFDAGTTPRNLRIKMTNLHADMDMFLFKQCDDWTGSVEFSHCEGISMKDGYAAEEINVYNATGKYIIVVDGFTHGVNSSFHLHIDCIAPPPPTYGCDHATWLKCGDRKWVDAPHQNHYDHNTYDLSGCLGYGYHYKGYDDLYKISAGYHTGKDIEIKLSGLHADMDLLVFRACTDHYGRQVLEQCEAVSTNSGTQSEKVVIHDAYGTYYISVDSDAPWYTSGYEIEVDCVEPTLPICHYATPLGCNESLWVNPSHFNHIDHDNYNLSGCHTYHNGYKGNEHLYKIDIGSNPRDVTIHVSNLSADLDMLLFKSCSDHYGVQSLGQCVATSTNSGHSDEQITLYGATGVYYLTVDADDPWDKSGYEIDVKCHETYTGYDCSDATWITCGDSHWSNAPTTNHLSGADYNFSACGYSFDDYEGADHLYKIDLGYQHKDIEIKLTGLSGDLDLFVFSACSRNYSHARFSACVGVSRNTWSASEKVKIDDAHGKYYIVVDSKHISDRSSYELEVHCVTDDPDPIDPEPVDTVVTPPPPPPVYTTVDTLRCGLVYEGSNVDTENNFERDDINQCFETRLVYTGNDVLVPFVKASDSSVIQLTMRHGDRNLSMFILDEDFNFVASGCRGINLDLDKTLQNGNDIVGEVYSDEGAMTAGLYYVLVDGYNRFVKSDFTLEMTCVADCTIQDLIGCNDIIEGAATDSTDHASIYNSVDSTGYAGMTGGEWSAMLEVDTMSPVVIDLHITNDADLDLFLLNSCTGYNVVAASVMRDTAHEQIIMTLDSGAYIIRVDGDAYGTFDVEVSGCDADTGAALVGAETRSKEPGFLGELVLTKNVMSQEVEVSPNPFAEQALLTLKGYSSEEGVLMIHTLDGKLLFEKILTVENDNQNVLINASDLGDVYGVLMYQWISGDQREVGRMIRVR